MAEFRYTALDKSGKEVTGALHAEDRSGALARLKSMGMYPMGLEVAAQGAAAVAAPGAAAPARAGGGIALFGGRVSASDLALFTRQLASLFNAGLNMARSLDTLIDHAENPTLRTTLEQVRQSVSGGSALWEAMAEHPRVFSELYVSLVQAGEASGQLGKVLERLADSLEKAEEYRSRIRSALAYPMLLITAGAGAVIFILVFLVPRFARIFGSLNRELPTPTKVLLATQAFVSEYGILMLVLGIGAFAALKAWERTEQGGLTMDTIRMKIPILGSIIHKDAVSRFCRTMSTLVEGGVPILSSFEVAERAVGNRVLRKAIEEVRNAVRGGEALADPLKRTGVFPSLVTNMIAVGEETGNLDEMLNRVADTYDAEIGNKMRQLVSLVEPMVILIMGAIIGTIVLSMLIPVMELSTAF
ncbi:MAG: type II secretion system F family protein [Armatimonadota bacterium]